MHKFTLILYMTCGNLQKQNAFNEYPCCAFITINLTANKTLRFALIQDNHWLCESAARSWGENFKPILAKNCIKFQMF